METERAAEGGVAGRRASLRDRLRRPTVGDLTGDDDERRLLAAKVGLYTYLGGGLLGSVGTLAAASRYPVDAVQIIGLAVAFLMAGLILVLFDRFAWWMAHTSTVVSTVIVACTLATRPGGALDPSHLFLLWNAMFAFFFYSRRAAWAHLLAIGVALVVVLRLAPGDADPVGTWIVLMGTFAGAGLLVQAQQARLILLTEREANHARTDYLTALPNRRAFVETLERVAAASRRDGVPFALLLGDIDHFKQLNDRLGHLEGDAALCRVASVLSRTARAGDMVARWGGEEFAVVASVADRDEAWTTAERLRVAVATLDPFAPITMSFGVAVFGLDGQDPAELERSADTALYHAKRTGRNRTHIAQGLDLEPPPTALAA